MWDRFFLSRTIFFGPFLGITFLAAGTSIPDAYASLLVSKQGQGDMAIANCFGSNVFDILVGLAVPWLIQTTYIDPSGYAIIFSKGLLYTVVLLFLTIIITASIEPDQNNKQHW